MGRPERPEIGLGRPKIEPFEAESTQQERQGQPDQASRPAKTRQAARLIAQLSARIPQLGRVSGNFVIDISKYFEIFGNIWKYLEIFPNISKYFEIF